ncbi:hypothetical protein KMW28_26415 [Flammeovirga yaeyamensis]|uniref:Uncharacterized protein n=1 Tax=Flammeovirga yaeyamensis TaxID=367791 RepID=A0AAX1NDZ0_9BACT|nr:hypothetical protein [Flammeovirga yaeyamensis]MBB3699162.1 hypothetical protein [Flammeovirga yaeyamensis]NMF35574.1 hypothetical protein [Flammeovirga yaeyamensis]QWG04432.1 hypothetical protein KMW28_26415 [Flammeovirga yaeyamensis]
MKLKQYLGILTGALYGLLLRLFFDPSEDIEIFKYYSINSISFFWIVPIIISVIPLLIGRKEVLLSKWKTIVYPVLSQILFFIITLSQGIEDWLCILILAFPFILVAGLVGLLITPLLKKKYHNKLYSIIFLPLIFSPIESIIPNNTKTYDVESSIIIEKTKSEVWANLIEVPEILEDEYQKGFFNYIGVPRPIKSEIKTVNGKEYRIGYFSDDLELYESISNINYLENVSFDIHINDSKLRNTPTDHHILKSDYFTFQNIKYELIHLSENKTKLILSCKYSINSKMNIYANFWAEQIIGDFEERLLSSLKYKLED